MPTNVNECQCCRPPYGLTHIDFDIAYFNTVLLDTDGNEIFRAYTGDFNNGLRSSTNGVLIKDDFVFCSVESFGNNGVNSFVKFDNVGQEDWGFASNPIGSGGPYRIISGSGDLLYVGLIHDRIDGPGGDQFGRPRGDSNSDIITINTTGQTEQWNRKSLDRDHCQIVEDEKLLSLPPSITELGFHEPYPSGCTFTGLFGVDVLNSGVATMVQYGKHPDIPLGPPTFGTIVGDIVRSLAYLDPDTGGLITPLPTVIESENLPLGITIGRYSLDFPDFIIAITNLNSDGRGVFLSALTLIDKNLTFEGNSLSIPELNGDFPQDFIMGKNDAVIRVDLCGADEFVAYNAPPGTTSTDTWSFVFETDISSIAGNSLNRISAQVAFDESESTWTVLFFQDAKSLIVKFDWDGNILWQRWNINDQEGRTIADIRAINARGGKVAIVGEAAESW